MSNGAIFPFAVLTAVAACALGCSVAVPAPAVQATSVAATLEPYVSEGGWFLDAARPADYEWATESEPSTPSGRARRLGHSAAEVTQGNFGDLMQIFAADNYRGSRVRFSARVCSKDVAIHAGLWMRVNGPANQLQQLAFQSHPVQGTTEWTDYSVVLDVPPSAKRIAIGVLLDGAGTVRFAEPRVEIVGTNVPASDTKNHW